MLSCRTRCNRTRVEATNSPTFPQGSAFTTGIALTFLSSSETLAIEAWSQMDAHTHTHTHTHMLDLGVNVDRQYQSNPKTFFSFSVYCALSIYTNMPTNYTRTTSTPLHSTRSQHTSYYTFLLSYMFVIIIFPVMFSEWNQESSWTFWKDLEKHKWGLFRVIFHTGRTCFSTHRLIGGDEKMKTGWTANP